MQCHFEIVHCSDFRMQICSFELIRSFFFTVMEYKSYTTTHPKSAEQQEKESKIAAIVDTQHPRGKQLYVGGLTWVRIVLLL